MKVIKLGFLPLIALALSFGSCQKESVENAPFKKGGDLDEPIIVGIGVYANMDPVYPGELKLYHGTTNALLDSADTDSEGGFSFNVSEGLYYLKLYDGEATLIATSETMDVTDSTYIVVSP